MVVEIEGKSGVPHQASSKYLYLLEVIEIQELVGMGNGYDTVDGM